MNRVDIAQMVELEDQYPVLAGHADKKALILGNVVKSIDNFLKAAKVYVENPSEAPKGIPLKRGIRGGVYYDSGNTSKLTKPALGEGTSEIEINASDKEDRQAVTDKLKRAMLDWRKLAEGIPDNKWKEKDAAIEAVGLIEMMSGTMENKNFLVDNNNNIIGGISYEIQGKKNKSCYISYLATSPKHMYYSKNPDRIRGIGSYLLISILEKAKSQGCSKVELSASDLAVPFYKKIGFKYNEVKNMELLL